MTQDAVTMRHHIPAFIVVVASALVVAGAAATGAGQLPAPTLVRPVSRNLAPGTDGFIKRWLILEPIAANGLTDSLVQAAVKKEYFPDQFGVLPHDGDTVKVGDVTLAWHAVDTKNYNVNLYHFAYALKKPTSNVLFWVVTVLDCPQQVRGVRLAVGSNAASVWWVNGREVIGIYGDRQSVVDDGVSKRLTLEKGTNIVRAAIVNGGGATDFCARILDADDRPLTRFTVKLPDGRKFDGVHRTIGRQRRSSMKYLVLAGLLVVASIAVALDGQIVIHDPSTVVQCDGRYYTFGTGGTALVSDDGWTWRAGTRAPRAGMAPDLIHVGDRYYQYISRNVGAQPKAEINMIWSKSLDPDSPDYKWVEGGVVVSTNGIEDCNGIDPGAFLDPTTGRLWLTYGSYFGYIRLVELDPKTGMRRYPNLRPFDIAINCEASTMIYREGWYYLLATHGSCCRGADSGYNIRVGRGRKPTGPFLDDNGIDMIQGGGKLVIGSGGRLVGPGHFGLLDLGDGVQKFSMHWEADFDRGGASVIDIRPLLWKDGWPIAGENAKDGTYAIESVRTGTALELAVEGIPVGGRRAGRGGAGMGPGSGAVGGQGSWAERRRPATAGQALRGRRTVGRGGMGGGVFGGSGSPLPDQDVNQVSANWPSGNLDARMGNYLCQAQQKWTLKAVPNGGGYPGSPYFRITVAGTERTLAATEEGELVVLPAFSGGPEQLWRLDQLADGSWRIMPKAVPNAKTPMALSAIGASSATLSKYDPAGNKHRWLLERP